MARVAAETLKAKKIRDTLGSDAGFGKGLYPNLFEDGDRATIVEYFEKAAALKDTTFEIDIQCNEDSVKWPGENKEEFPNGPIPDKTTDVDTMFYLDDFRLEEDEGTMLIWLKNPDPVELPRKTVCERGALAYTVNGFLTEVGDMSADLSNQIRIILCPFIFTDQGYDTRRIPDIFKDGLEKGNAVLDFIEPISATLLHKFMHTTPVSRPIDEDACGKISDELNKDGERAYGLGRCRDLKKTNPKATATNADSYELLGVALSLQFREPERGGLQFTWSTGAVRMGDEGRKDYLSYVPPRKPNAIGLDAMVAASDMLAGKKREFLGQRGQNQNGWKTFFA